MCHIVKCNGKSDVEPPPTSSCQFPKFIEENLLKKPPRKLSQRAMSQGKHSCWVCSSYDKDRVESSVFKNLTKLTIFKVFCRSAQPAHLVVMSCVITLAVILYPSGQPKLSGIELPGKTVFWPMLYLSSFSILFGAQMWMTFISGLVLLFTLPRHSFARVQSALFPKYMLLNGIAALAVLVSFAQTKEVWASEENHQVIALSITCFFPLMARLIVVPSLLECIRCKMVLERAAGHGPEAGPKLNSATEEILKECTTYTNTAFRFRHFHAIVAVVNVVTLACNAFHLYYLSSKITFY